jgi:hypothetical protein
VRKRREKERKEKGASQLDSRRERSGGKEETGGLFAL